MPSSQRELKSKRRQAEIMSRLNDEEAGKVKKEIMKRYLKIRTIDKLFEQTQNRSESFCTTCKYPVELMPFGPHSIVYSIKKEVDLLTKKKKPLKNYIAEPW